MDRWRQICAVVICLDPDDDGTDAPGARYEPHDRIDHRLTIGNILAEIYLRMSAWGTEIVLDIDH